nr:hypothetical protein [Tanacetum cinerariifolium]
MPTPPPLPLISLSPPSAGERLARLTAPSAFVDAVTTALPPTSLYIPPLVDRRDDIPESEQPPRKMACLSTLGSRYEIGESSTRGRGVDYGFVSTVDAEMRHRGVGEVRYGIRDTWVDPAEAVPEVAPTNLDKVSTRVTELAELHEHDTHDLYALLEDAQDDPPGAGVCTGVPAPGTSDAATVAGDGSHSSHEDNQRNVQTARPCFYANFMKCQPLNFKGTEGVVGLTRWIEKMKSIFQISGCAIENPVKFTTCTLLDATLTWWNGHIRSLGPDAYSMTWEVLKKKMTDKANPDMYQVCCNKTKKIDKYVGGLPDNIYGSVKASKPKTLDETIELANDLMDQKLCTYPERQTNNKRKADDSFRNNHGHQQQLAKRQNVAKVYNMGSGERKPYEGNLPKFTKSSGNTNIANAQRDNRETPKGNGFYECGASGHFKKDYPKLKNKNVGNGNAQGWVYAVGNAKKNGNASKNPDSNVVTGTFLLNNRYASILFDTSADRSFISTAFSSLIDIVLTPLGSSYDVELADGKIVRYHAMIICDEKLVRITYGNETLIFRGNESYDGIESRLTVISCSKAQDYMAKGCQIFLAQISAKKEEDKSKGKQLKDVPIVQNFPEVFPEDLSCLPPARPVEF